MDHDLTLIDLSVALFLLLTTLVSLVYIYIVRRDLRKHAFVTGLWILITMAVSLQVASQSVKLLFYN